MANVARLRAFNHRPTCAKCGAADPQFKHADEKEICDSVGDYYAERIICVCNRCGFKWCMACKDKSEAK